MEDILELPEANDKTEQHVRNIVRKDDKGRFALRESRGILQIKATQGHSLEVILYSTFHKIDSSAYWWNKFNVFLFSIVHVLALLISL